MTTRSRTLAVTAAFAWAAIGCGARFTHGMADGAPAWDAVDATSDVAAVVARDAVEVRSVEDARPPERIVALSGNAGACVIDESGRVWCWGWNDSGTNGDGSAESRPRPIRVNLPGPAIDVARGNRHACAVLATGEVYCWGRWPIGEVAVTVRRAIPTRVDVPARVVEVACGEEHVCARTVEGNVWCWGSNAGGQLGRGDDAGSGGVAVVPGLVDVVQINSRFRHTCAVQRDATLWCWGANEHGQVDMTESPYRNLPRQVPGLSRVVRVATGVLETCAGVEDGTVECWGSNVRVPDGMRYAWGMHRLGITGHASLVSLTYSHGCAALAGGGAECWGDNESGQCGNGSFSWDPRPTRVSGSLEFVAIDVGGDSSYAIDRAGTVWSWGAAWQGALGDGSVVVRNVPQRVTF